MSQRANETYTKDHGFDHFLVIFFSTFLIATLSLFSTASAAQITLGWNPPGGGSLVDGYRIYSRLEGQTYNYSQPIWQGTTTTCTITNVQAVNTYFVARAYNSYAESGDSNEVVYQPATTSPAISRTPSSLSVSCTQGSNATSQSFQISNSGGGPLSYSISDDATWLSCSPTAGTSTGEQDTIAVSYATSGLAAGSYSATITVTATGASNTPQTIPVSLTVGARAAAISRNPVSLFPSCVQGANASSQTFQVWNSGGGTLSYTISDNVGWLACNAASGTSTGEQDTVTVTYSTSTMIPGTYSATITIGASGVSNSPQTIPVTLSIVTSNLAPAKPVIISPYNGQLECDPLLRVQTEAFSDPDSGDSHSTSQWQISSQPDFSSLLLDVTSTAWLTELPVPHAVLDRAVTYSVRVRFYDSRSEASEWSDPIDFTTLSTSVDDNGNGIPDAREVSDTVDLNGDGIADNDQPELIKSAKTAGAGNIAVGVCKGSDSITEIEALDTVEPSEILDKKNKPKNFPFGLCAYRLKVDQPGATALVTLHYSSAVSSANGFYIYDTIHGWQNYSQHVTFNEDHRSVTLELKDGDFGDSDGVANGVIVDPGGVVVADSIPDIGGGGGVAAACFIATAAGDDQPGERANVPLIAGLLLGVALVGYVLRLRK